ncbi:hypothetical protein PoMZ_10846 [Pyricularia oryzae]|uniref:Heterokaryon incompatibility domain-containing protein n=1 Tax=Pyricularia oryzae TaxID=318829 RepID=A0A4P7NIW0_PYROR|nr:hypothetical protein PoMZ_10846 [Pyricularia oryzae]
MELFKGPADIYRPLEGSEIRLITLKRTGRSSDQPIEAQLYHAPLETAKYFALSYPWGTPGATRTILVNGIAFPVFESLFLALVNLQLRRGADLVDPPMADAPAQEARDAGNTDDDEIPTAWWIDAICINQKSLVERTKQVSRMGLVYSMASKVVIWPGDLPICREEILNAAIADASVKYTRSLVEAYPELTSKTPSAGITFFEDSVCADIIAKHNLLSRSLMGAMSTLLWTFHQHYFTRVWTFQEAVVAQSSPIVLLGTYSVPLMCMEWLRGGWGAVSKMPPYRDSVSIKARVALQASSVAPIVAARASLHQALSSGSELECFASQLSASLRQSVGWRSARDPRDRIYGMLGVTKLPVPMPPELEPDYERAFDQVAFSYAKFLIRNHNRLDLLGMGVNSLAGYPSWVPNFDGGTGLATEPSKVQSVATLSTDGTCLIAKGTVIGSVIKVLSRPDVDGQRGLQARAAQDSALAMWSAFLDQIVCPAAVLRSVSSELVLRELLEAYQAEDMIDSGDSTVLLASLGATEATEATGRASGVALNNSLQRLQVVFSFMNFVLLEDGCIMPSPVGVRHDPKPGDVVSAIRGFDLYAVLRRLDTASTREGFCIIDAFCLGTGSLPMTVTEEVFANRVETDFDICPMVIPPSQLLPRMKPFIPDAGDRTLGDVDAELILNSGC